MESMEKTQRQNPLDKDPNTKEYIYLSEKGKQKYIEVSRQAYKVFLIYLAIGVGAGYTAYKFVDYVRSFRRFPRMGRFLFITTTFFFTYHGYKLMEYTKRKGQRNLSKNPEYVLTRQEYENKSLTNKVENA